MTIGAIVNPIAGAQADATRSQAEASVKVAEVHARTDRLREHHSFWLRVLFLGALGGAIVGGFVTGRYELVTHALAVAAGVGLGRAVSPKA